MSVRNLDSLFRPKCVALVGASERLGSVGAALFRNLREGGFEGPLYPVNPKHAEVQGLKSHPTLTALPKKPDLAILCTPARTIPGLVRECGELGIHGVLIISAGFRETGAEGKALETALRAEAAKFPELRIIGPNCLGIIHPALGLNASFAAGMPQPGRVAFVSQSGALCTAVLDWALDQGIGFSHFVSIGNALDVDFGDLIDYFGTDPNTRAMLLYIESIADAREFLSAARSFARTKPIVAYKSGRFAASARAAASHTGAMAGEDAVFDAAFRRAGIERVFTIDDLFDTAELLARGKTPAKPALAIVTNAGGPGVMATDCLEELGGELAALQAETLARLNELLPASWSHGNPIDVLGDAPAERVADAVAAALEDPGVGAILTILAPQAMTDPTRTAQLLIERVRGIRKPVLACWMGGRTMREGIDLLNQAGIPTYDTPEKAVRAHLHLVSYARNLASLYETPREVRLTPPLDRPALRTRLKPLLDPQRDMLPEGPSKELIAAYGIPVTRVMEAATGDEAAAAAAELGYPVALKILSPQITHKTDVGGVVLSLRTDEEVRRAFTEITARARQARPDAEIKGVTVQPMVDVKSGVELIVGAKKDATFGTVLMVGAGGVTAELYKDRALELPPLDERLARRMLETLKSWPLLTGYRGRPELDVDAAVEALLRFSYLVSDFPEIREIDLNPLVVLPEGAIVLDARVAVESACAVETRAPYSHLSIRPYPEEFIRPAATTDGETILLRPIRPEDEPRWKELIGACSPETLYTRFRSVFREVTHDMAIRYCCGDYDREMGLVAEIQKAGETRLAGFARLVADPDRRRADFGVLVCDEWQGKGIGVLLTEHSLHVARAWGMAEVIAETTPDNPRMIGIFQELGFEVRHVPEESAVFARLVL